MDRMVVYIYYNLKSNNTVDLLTRSSQYIIYLIRVLKTIEEGYDKNTGLGEQ